eukprot:2817274-Rhodomonas_salina.1
MGLPGLHTALSDVRPIRPAEDTPSIPESAFLCTVSVCACACPQKCHSPRHNARCSQYQLSLSRVTRCLYQPLPDARCLYQPRKVSSSSEPLPERHGNYRAERTSTAPLSSYDVAMPCPGTKMTHASSLPKDLLCSVQRMTYSSSSNSIPLPFLEKNLLISQHHAHDHPTNLCGPAQLTSKRPACRQPGPARAGPGQT